MNIYLGDVRVNDNGIVYRNGQPDMDDGLGTAVYLSLFLDRGWWGDPTSGSDLYKYEDANATQDTANEIKDICVDALAWMKTSGIADDITVTTDVPRPDFIAIEIEIQEPGKKDATTYRYGISWRETEEALNVYATA